jgi:hypothetical protein
LFFSSLLDMVYLRCASKPDSGLLRGFVSGRQAGRQAT